MIHHIVPQGTDKVITLGSEIVYGQRREWCGATWRPLRMSFMRSRQYFYYDEKETLPLLVFFCGGGYTTVDHNVWMPELAWYAKRGWAVASVEYSVTARTKFPEQLEDCKQAIRWLRAHAEDLGIDPNRVVVMGESAGAYMSDLVGLTGEAREYDKGEYPQQSSAVQGVVSFYAPVTPASSTLMDERRRLLEHDRPQSEDRRRRRDPGWHRLDRRSAEYRRVLSRHADLDLPRRRGHDPRRERNARDRQRGPRPRRDEDDIYRDARLRAQHLDRRDGDRRAARLDVLANQTGLGRRLPPRKRNRQDPRGSALSPVRYGGDRSAAGRDRSAAGRDRSRPR